VQGAIEEARDFLESAPWISDRMKQDFKADPYKVRTLLRYAAICGVPLTVLKEAIFDIDRRLKPLEVEETEGGLATDDYEILSYFSRAIRIFDTSHAHQDISSVYKRAFKKLRKRILVDRKIEEYEKSLPIIPGYETNAQLPKLEEPEISRLRRRISAFEGRMSPEATRAVRTTSFLATLDYLDDPDAEFVDDEELEEAASVKLRSLTPDEQRAYEPFRTGFYRASLTPALISENVLEALCVYFKLHKTSPLSDFLSNQELRERVVEEIMERARTVYPDAIDYLQRMSMISVPLRMRGDDIICAGGDGQSTREVCIVLPAHSTIVYGSRAIQTHPQKVIKLFEFEDGRSLSEEQMAAILVHVAMHKACPNSRRDLSHPESLMRFFRRVQTTLECAYNERSLSSVSGENKDLTLNFFYELSSYPSPLEYGHNRFFVQ
jgi:hypothetical protein